MNIPIPVSGESDRVTTSTAVMPSTAGAALWSRRMADSMIIRHTPATARWHYEHGLLLWAIDQVGLASGDSASGDTRYRQYVRDICDLFIGSDGEIRTWRKEEYNLDQINHGNILFPLWRESGENRYQQALDLLRLQMAHQPYNGRR